MVTLTSFDWLVVVVHSNGSIEWRDSRFAKDSSTERIVAVQTDISGLKNRVLTPQEVQRVRTC